ncbi:MAG: rRNA pseudouridine synthase [Candidatus Staskawiczbacteria bacterium]|nr:rRNA pseudouridine synthase [Candidatus Staskawiczbacteria bacterium]
MRINKFLTYVNYCSRREGDRLIEKKEVKINKKIAVLGDQVEKNDQVFVKGKLLTELNDPKIYLVFHKPIGVISTTDASAKNNIIQSLNYSERVYPVGRLDVASSGLMILTNDGEIVNKILKAENKIEKEYLVGVDKTLTEKFLQQLQSGVVLDGYQTLPAMVKKKSDKTFSMIIVEGKNRQIRRMCNTFGYNVVSLTRIRIGKISLIDLKIAVGKFKKLSQKVIMSSLGLV